jgi:hypothetical protein
MNETPKRSVTVLRIAQSKGEQQLQNNNPLAHSSEPIAVQIKSNYCEHGSIKKTIPNTFGINIS